MDRFGYYQTPTKHDESQHNMNRVHNSQDEHVLYVDIMRRTYLTKVFQQDAEAICRFMNMHQYQKA